MKPISPAPRRNAPRNLVFFSPRGLTVVVVLACAGGVSAQTNVAVGSASQLKKFSLEELLNLEVTTVSRRPEKLTEAASAIQVITQEDIRRAGATSIPEALRL